MTKNQVALRSFDLITLPYRNEQMKQHAELSVSDSGQWAETVMQLRLWFDARSILDYGCGQGGLRKALADRSVECREYDPAIPGKDSLPGFADLIVVTHVLEHVEVEKLGNVLDHIGLIARKAIFVVSKTVKPSAWWDAKCDEHHWQRVDLDLPIPLTPAERAERFIGVFVL